MTCLINNPTQSHERTSEMLQEVYSHTRLAKRPSSVLEAAFDSLEGEVKSGAVRAWVGQYTNSINNYVPFVSQVTINTIEHHAYYRTIERFIMTLKKQKQNNYNKQTNSLDDERNSSY